MQTFRNQDEKVCVNEGGKKKSNDACSKEVSEAMKSQDESND